jgi:hypothetical protein
MKKDIFGKFTMKMRNFDKFTMKKTNFGKFTILWEYFHGNRYYGKIPHGYMELCLGWR